ncbi:DinB superfamily protein [Candidatus Zixiibacteriota bacterium]|nr:DinB superfamily protein [candidate division Zixibacteria bacterium]
MIENERILDQLHRAYYGEAWHGPALSEVLKGVSARKAVLKPLKKAHSIWEIVLHIAGCEDYVRRLIEGEKLKLTPEQDWPPIARTGEKAWQEALRNLKDIHDRLEATVRALPDEKLYDNIGDANQTAYHRLHGVIQHDLYHAGQIAILRK